MICQQTSFCSDINRNKSSAGLSFSPVFDGLASGKIGQAVLLVALGVEYEGYAPTETTMYRAECCRTGSD